MNIQTIQLSQSNTTNSKSNQLNLKLPFPADIKNYDVALSNAFIYYSWRNVTTAYGNRTFSYSWNGVTYPVTLPDGNYSVSDLNNYLQTIVMNANGHYLVDSNGNKVYYISLTANPTYYAVTLTCTPIPSSLPSGYTNPAGITLSGNTPLLIINNSAFGSLIGFSTGTYPAVTQTSIYQLNSNITAQISPVTSVNITCNMVNNSRFNSVSPQTIYTFSPQVSYTSQINIQPSVLQWYKCIDQTYSYITVELKDQNGNDLALIDTNWVVTLLLRPKQIGINEY